jgi:hypothetical protein
MGTLKQEITQLKEQLAAAPGSVSTQTPPPPPPPEKTLDAQIKEIEDSLTDGQRKAADELLEKMTDEEALQFTQDKKHRLEFLTGLKNDPALRVVARPKSFWNKAADPAAPAAGENAYDVMVKRIRGTRPGPSGAPGVTRTGNPAKAGERTAAEWLK